MIATCSTPVVSFRSVVALADHFPVLSGVDLDLQAGEVVLVEGANGAGKTSLLRTIAGLLRPSQGEATVLGFDLFDQVKAVRRNVGFLGHDSLLYGDLSVRENVEFFVRAAGGNVKSVQPCSGAFGFRRSLGLGSVRPFVGGATSSSSARRDCCPRPSALAVR